MAVAVSVAHGGGHVGRHADLRRSPPASTPIVLPGLKPNQPNHRIEAADRGGRHVVTGNGVDLAVGTVLADARAEDDDAHQGRPAADRVHLRASRRNRRSRRSPASRRPKSSDRRPGR